MGTLSLNCPHVSVATVHPTTFVARGRGKLWGHRGTLKLQDGGGVRGLYNMGT